MIKETEGMRAELSSVAMEIARILSTEGYDEAELATYRPTFVFVDEENRIVGNSLRACAP